VFSQNVFSQHMLGILQEHCVRLRVVSHPTLKLQQILVF
jgi:hypothetical protein